MNKNKKPKVVLSEIDKSKDSLTPVCEKLFDHDGHENKITVGVFNYIAIGYTKDDIKYTLLYNAESNRILLIWKENDILHYTTKPNLGTKGYDCIGGHFGDFMSNTVNPFAFTGKIYTCAVSTSKEIRNASSVLRDLITDTSISIDEYNDKILEYAFKNPIVKDRY